MAQARDVEALLERLQAEAGARRSSNAEQLEVFQQAQELVLRRDPSGVEFALLRGALPFLLPLSQLQNAALAAAILQLLARAAEASSAASLATQTALSTALFEAAHTVLLLSYSTEKNALLALQSARAGLAPAFERALRSASVAELQGDAHALLEAVQRTLETAMDLVTTGPLATASVSDVSSNNNQSGLVWLRAWKYLEAAALLLSSAQDSAVFRDPARSNVQPDALTVDRVADPESRRVLERPKLEALGATIVERMSARIADRSAGPLALGRRELCVAVNSLSLLASLRPHLVAVVVPQLTALAAAPAMGGTTDLVVHRALASNLVKLLSHPSAQPFVDEITDVLIAAGASERAFRAISKSKEPRRKYVSDVSLQKTRVGKRSAAQTITERVENANAKRRRVAAPSSAQSPSSQGPEKITQEGIVNMPTVEVVNLVLESFSSEMPAPAPADVKLELAPSELKTRMTALLAKLATPSSVLALEKSVKRSRDPRRRRDPRVQAMQNDQPALVQIFDDASIEEVSDWISKNAASIAEPVISVAEDNTVQVYLKPVDAVWCREMAVDAFQRILENEYGVKIRGDDKLREFVLCRLASDPWLLLCDEKNKVVVDPCKSPDSLPVVYKTILDFALDNCASRSSLATRLLRQEYFRATTMALEHSSASNGAVPPIAAAAADGSDSTAASASTAREGIYRKAVTYLFDGLRKKMDVSSAADRKLFGGLVAQLPCVTVELLTIAKALLDDKHGVVLGITVLRDLVKERQVCQGAGLLLLLRYTCHDDEHCRNSAIRCVANQLYSVSALKSEIEAFAARLVGSLRQPQTETAAAETTEEAAKPLVDEAPAGDVDMAGDQDTAQEATTSDAVVTDDVIKTEPHDDGEAAAADSHVVEAPHQLRAKRHVKQALVHHLDIERELLAFATACQQEMALGAALEEEVEILRRLELFLALCAKKPSLLTHLLAAYAHASEVVRQVIFQAIEKLIKHLKQRGSASVVAQLHGFEAPALGLVCHVLQILAVRPPRTSGAASSASDDGVDELVAQTLALYRAHAHVPDAISVLIPVLPSVRPKEFFPLLPALLSLPAPRLSVALTKLLEAMPPPRVSPIDLLVALHRVDLAREPGLQKKAIHAINCCVEHRHAFPSDVLLHVCRVLVRDGRVSKLALRTLILSVTAYPALQRDMAVLLGELASRRVWELGDAHWKGFVKCAALIQPASLPLLATQLPIDQLRAALEDEPTLAPLLAEFLAAHAAELRVSPDVQAIVDSAVAAQAVKAEPESETVEPETEHVKTEPVAVEVEVDDKSAVAVDDDELVKTESNGDATAESLDASIADESAASAPPPVEPPVEQ